jgi:NitT/TauT family transport system ATP-binding protein
MTHLDQSVTAQTPSTEPRLSFSDVEMVFPDGTHTLTDVSFDVHPGEFVTVVGPSGCGKSTLLRIASGLETETGGTVEVDRSNIGFVFQDATLLDWRVVKDNVELFAELHDMPQEERSQRSQHAIDLVGLSGFEQHYPRALSGGMKMRASIARSLMMSPPVFLFDEPFGALDEITRENLQAELMDLFVSENFAGLFITHSIYEAVYLSTRVLVMSNRPGRIVADIAVPFEYPRSQDLRFDPAFAELAGQVSHELRGAH